MAEQVYGFGKSEVQRIRDAVVAYERQPTSGPGGPSGSLPVPEPEGCWAEITDNLAFDDNPNRFKYAWHQKRLTTTGSDDQPDGLSGTTTERYALNTLEDNNPDKAGMMGNSVDTDATGTTLAAAQGNPVVWMRFVWQWDAAEAKWVRGFRFSYENTVECGGEEA